MKTSKKHFELFKSEFLYWIDIWKLDEWKIYFIHEQLPDSYACISKNVTAMNVRVSFCTKWFDEGVRSLTADAIKETAKHEAIHLLLGRLSAYGSSRIVSSDELTESEEALVRKLQKLLCK